MDKEIIKNVYVIRETISGLYDYEDGDFTNNIFEANKFSNYKNAHNSLWETFDEPTNFEIVRCSMIIKIEEVM